MDTDLSLGELVVRVRQGDERAKTALVRRIESALSRCVRVWLRDPRLHRQVDTMDVCQSVLLNFFQRVDLGQYELGSSEDVLKVLMTMARNKFLNLVERENAQKRDSRRNMGLAAAELGLADQGSSPSFRVHLEKKMTAKARQRLAGDERQLVELRRQEKTWDEIGAELTLSPEAARKKHDRAVERVAKELGFA